MVLHVDELLWLSLDLNGEHKETPLKKLTELCIQKLINGAVLPVRRLPSKIHALVLSSAIAHSKVFTVENLMRWCPYETIQVHAPSTLKSLHSLPERNRREVLNVYEDFLRLATRMLLVFFDLIENNSTNSKLKCLDLGVIPVTSEVYDEIRLFLWRLQGFSSRQCLNYVLKCSFIMTKSTDVFKLTCCMDRAKALGFKFIISGVFFYNNFYPEVTVINLLEHLSAQDVQLFGFNFSTLLPSIEPTCDILCSFKHVKYLDMSYLPNALNSESSIRAFASALIEFPFLERLVLKGLTLTGLMPRLFQEFCNKDCKRGTASKCCIVHKGTLEYLDISRCRLVDRDIEILRELALKKFS